MKLPALIGICFGELWATVVVVVTSWSYKATAEVTSPEGNVAVLSRVCKVVVSLSGGSGFQC